MTEINSIGANPQAPNAVLPMCRIVAGHPMIFAQEKDWVTKQPKVNTQGQPKMSAYFAVAIPKGGETHWNQTQWGSLIWQEGAAGFPRGEFNRPDFAWKIVDGDSTIPNKNGTIPNTQEGYANHWVLSLSTSLAAPKCFKVNPQFGIVECVSDKEIKRGDYGRVTLTVKANCDANGFAQSPGVYLNPIGFCMDKEGQEIVGDGAPTVNPAMAYGAPAAAPTQQTAPAYQPPVQQAAPAYQPPVQQAAPVQPNNTWQNPPPPAGAQAVPVVRMVNYNGQTVKVDDLLAGGWTEAQIAQHTTPAV